MSRPQKINEVPIAPFDLRELGPTHVDELTRRLGGKPYRVAPGAAVDKRATIDPTPCPSCGGVVEWAATSKRTAKGLERYAFARCRRHPDHRWGFRGTPHDDVVATPAAVRAELGGATISATLDAQISELRDRLEKLEEMRRVARDLGLS